MACTGVLTISSFSLKDVFSRTGTPVLSPKQRISFQLKQVYVALHRLEAARAVLVRDRRNDVAHGCLIRYAVTMKGGG